MTIHTTDALVAKFISNGGKISISPTRTPQGGYSPQRQQPRKSRLIGG